MNLPVSEISYTQLGCITWRATELSALQPDVFASFMHSSCEFRQRLTLVSNNVLINSTYTFPLCSVQPPKCFLQKKTTKKTHPHLHLHLLTSHEAEQKQMEKNSNIISECIIAGTVSVPLCPNVIYSWVRLLCNTAVWFYVNNSSVVFVIRNLYLQRDTGHLCLASPCMAPTTAPKHWTDSWGQEGCSHHRPIFSLPFWGRLTLTLLTDLFFCCNSSWDLPQLNKQAMLYFPNISQDPLTIELQSNSKDGVSRGKNILKNHTSNKKQAIESKEGGECWAMNSLRLCHSFITTTERGPAPNNQPPPALSMNIFVTMMTRPVESFAAFQ